MRGSKFRSRRSMLKTIGAGTACVFGVSSGTNADNSLSNDWECSEDCPDDEIVVETIDLPNGVDYEREGAVAIHLKRSYYDVDTRRWHHIFDVSGAASSTDQGISGGEIYGQRYELNTVLGYDLKPSTASDKHGQYPNDEDSRIPGWAQPLMEATIGTLNVGAGWFLAVGETLREEMGHRPDGFSIHDNGFEYGDMATSFWSPSPWTECGFFHRVELVTDVRGQVNIIMGFSTHDSWASTTWRELDGYLDFYLDDPDWSQNDVDSSKSANNPENWPKRMREKYGIKDVRDKEMTVEGSSDGDSVAFVATDPNVEFKDVEVKTRSERQMDDPYSNRYRD